MQYLEVKTMKHTRKLIPALMITGVVMVTLSVSPFAKHNFISASANSGANIERSLTVTGLVHEGTYYYRSEDNKGYFDRYFVYELQNPGSYALMQLNVSCTYKTETNDCLMQFTPRYEYGWLSFYIRANTTQHYVTEEDYNNRTNAINLVDYRNLHSIDVKMSKDNEGVFQIPTDNTTVTYDEETMTYHITNLSSYVEYALDITTDSIGKLYSIESVTFTYTC